MFASFLTGLLLVATPGTLALTPDRGSTSEEPAPPVPLTLALDSGDRLIAFRERADTLFVHRQSLAPESEVGPTQKSLGLNAAAFDKPDFGIAARVQDDRSARLQVRLGQRQPLKIALTDARTHTNAELSWQALPFLTLRGKSQGNRANLSGQISFGPNDRHSFSLERRLSMGNVSGVTDARLTFGGTIPTSVRYSVPDGGQQRLSVRQDLGPLRWELRQQPEYLSLKTSLTLDRKGAQQRLALDFAHSARDLAGREQSSLTVATLESHWQRWHGSVGLGWNARGETGAIVSARFPMLRSRESTLDFVGSYQGVSSTGYRNDYRFELRGRLQI